jgi:hypothetical protein
MRSDLGNVDGEIPQAAIVKVTGSGWADRAMLLGERVALTVIGEVVSLGFKTEKGVPIRIHTVRAESMAELTDKLAEDVTDFLRAVEDEREGRRQLPLEDEEGDE